MQKRALCLWLPRWPTERLAAARAELNGRPLMLYEQSAHGGLRVVAFTPSLGNPRRAPGVSAHPRSSGIGSGIAAKIGIRPGMPLAEAVALYESALHRDAAPPDATPPALHVEAYDPLADRLALEALAQGCQRFSPLVALEDAPRPQSLLLDVSGLAALFGGEPRLVALVAEQLAERGLTVRAAIADTLGAAWAVAHYGQWLAPRSGVPGGNIVPAGETLAALAPLPLAALRLPSASVEMLAELGLRRIGQLAALPRATLLGRFGAEPLRRLDEALATAADVMIAERPANPLAASRTLEFPTDRREAIEMVLEQLLGGLAAPLAAERRGILRLTCRLVRTEGPAVQFEVGLYRASGSVAHLMELVKLRLEGLRFQTSRRPAVEAVQLTVTAAAPLAAEQQELFSNGNRREAPRQLAALVDRLSSRLGREAVVRPCLLADAQPEYACQYLPLDALENHALRNRTLKNRTLRNSMQRPSQRSKPRQGKTSAQRPAAAANDSVSPVSKLLQGERPLRLFAPPQALEATSIVPDGPPLRFCFQGREQRIVQTWGPERIETAWWRGRCVRRDYYRVETDTGSRFWLFRRLADGRWFLQGEFE